MLFQNYMWQYTCHNNGIWAEALIAVATLQLVQAANIWPLM